MDTPKIPTLKDTKKPQVKLRGMEVGVTFFERLRQFKKKDLAFILAGLGTLLMAPLAEHFMMAPETGEGTLHQGWGKAGSGLFGGGSSPYEPGSSGLAPGSAIGGGTDIITPLNVRDPAMLVMGMGATQQPPTNSVAPTTPPPTAPSPSRDDLRDALSASSRGVGEGTKAAKPMAKIALSGSNLRGLGVTNGGSSTSASLAPISSSGLIGNKANAGGGGLSNVRAMPSYKGVSRGQSQGGGGLEALKKAGEAAGSEMNRGAASTALDNAAAQGIPGGGSSFGGGGAGGVGGTDKPFGGNQEKSAKSVGESLAFLKQKAIQDKQIELWAKEQEAGDNKLQMLKMRNSIADAIAGKIGGALGDAISCPLTKNFQKCFNPKDAGIWVCDINRSTSPDGTNPKVSYPGDKVGDCTESGIIASVGADKIMRECISGSGDKATGRPGTGILGYNCYNTADADPSKDKPTDPDQGAVVFGQGQAQSEKWTKSMQGICSDIDAIENPPVKKTDGKIPELNAKSVEWLTNLKTLAAQTLAVRNTLYQGPGTAECMGISVSVTYKAAPSKSLIILEDDARKAFGNATGGTANPSDAGFLPQVYAGVGYMDLKIMPRIEGVQTAIRHVTDALQAVDSASKAINSAKIPTPVLDAEEDKKGTTRSVGGKDANDVRYKRALKLKTDIEKAIQEVQVKKEKVDGISESLGKSLAEAKDIVEGDNGILNAGSPSRNHGTLGDIIAINKDYGDPQTGLVNKVNNPRDASKDGWITEHTDKKKNTVESIRQAMDKLEGDKDSLRKTIADNEDSKTKQVVDDKQEVVRGVQQAALQQIWIMRNTQQEWTKSISATLAETVTAPLAELSAAPPPVVPAK